jgi:hypothetical protein
MTNESVYSVYYGESLAELSLNARCFGTYNSIGTAHDVAENLSRRYAFTSIRFNGKTVQRYQKGRSYHAQPKL